MQIVNTPWGTPGQIYNITRAGKHIWAEQEYARTLQEPHRFITASENLLRIAS